MDEIVVVVERISMEAIKPSTLTPPHLRHYKLSLVDQLAPWIYCIYMPAVMCYAPPPDPSSSRNNKNAILSLKTSLSKTLSLFYPLAGRFTDDESTINCNDEGFPFVVARANLTLSDFLNGPHRVDSLHLFLPVEKDVGVAIGTKNEPSITRRLMSSRQELIKELVQFAVQVTEFECGGVAIAWLALHKLLDGTSVRQLLSSWTHLNTVVPPESGCYVGPIPDFAGAAKMFPPLGRGEDDQVPKGRVPLPFWPSSEQQGGCPCVIKPFVFTAEAIASLRVVGATDQVRKPTRMEAVSAFIWKHATLAADFYSNSGSWSSMVIMLANIRGCTKPALPNTSIGNLIMHGISEHKREARPLELKELIMSTRRAVSRAKDPGFLKAVVGEKGRELLLQSRNQVGDVATNTERAGKYKFNTWGKIDLDFGFGKPIWTGISGGHIISYFKNLTIFIELPNGGLEAWITLNEHKMHIFESNPEFLAFASPLVGGKKSMSML